MDFDRRAFLAAGTAAAAVPTRLLAQGEAALRPEDFGARGDGVANDTAAFAHLSAEVTRRGGGTIALGRGKTYIVGRQSRGGQFGWSPEPIIELHKLPRQVRILGNGARLKCQPGLRFGTFDLKTGEPVHHPMPNLRIEEVACPYRAMIAIQDCTAPVEIRDVELDGNVAGLRLGGQYGDVGWQIPATGILLFGNRASETIVNCQIHHHALDGLTIIGDPVRSACSWIEQVKCRYNGRQGASITAGRGYDFADCDFSFTGRSTVHSPPGAGVDIEAEDRPNRDFTFTRCTFRDNSGCGLVADSGDSAGVHFTDCTFVGTTSWCAWPYKPRFAFDSCTFAGSVVHAFPSPDSELAAKFRNCRFTDDSALSPTGKLYLPDGPIVNLAASENVRFSGCTFDLAHDGVLPWSWQAIYEDCTMRQASKQTAMTKGKYLGRTTIDGPVNLYGSMVVGTLIVNGKQVPHGPQGVPPW
jgi:hypothetical protein